MLWYGASPWMGWTSTPGKADSNAARETSAPARARPIPVAPVRDRRRASRSGMSLQRGQPFGDVGAERRPEPEVAGVVVAQCGVQLCGLLDAARSCPASASGTSLDELPECHRKPVPPNGFARHEGSSVAPRDGRGRPATPPRRAPNAAVPSAVSVSAEYDGGSTVGTRTTTGVGRQVDDHGEDVVEHSRLRPRADRDRRPPRSPRPRPSRYEPRIRQASAPRRLALAQFVEQVGQRGRDVVG